jgi:chemotaxis response regulator CheB
VVKQDTTESQLVVIGSSAGGIEALSRVVASLPADFAAPIVIALNEELTARVEELRVANEDLAARTEELRLQAVALEAPGGGAQSPRVRPRQPR